MCEISGALHLAQPSLMVGRQVAGRQTKYRLISKCSKLAVSSGLGLGNI